MNLFFLFIIFAFAWPINKLWIFLYLPCTSHEDDINENDDDDL